MRLSRTRQWLRKDFLARVRGVPSAATVCVTTHITIHVADIVPVFFCELFVCDEFEGAAPENETFFETETDTFEEEGVLEATVVFEVGVASKNRVEILHAKREVG